MKDYRILFSKLLIKTGKLLPYILCSILIIEHSESLYAFQNNILYNENGVHLLYTPISWAMNAYTNYGWISVLSLFILSIAFQCCWRHRLAIYYLGINLIEKQIIENVTMDVKYIPYYLAINIIVIIALLVLGILQLIKNKETVYDR